MAWKVKLQYVIDNLTQWQVAHRGNTSKRCLEAVRAACLHEGLRLPMSEVDYKGKLAIDCFNTLAKDPEKWGWTRVTRDANGNLPNFTLVFFKKCGFILRLMKYAGHIAILDWKGKKHYSNENHPYTQYWDNRIVGAFCPKKKTK